MTETAAIPPENAALSIGNLVDGSAAVPAKRPRRPDPTPSAAPDSASDEGPEVDPEELKERARAIALRKLASASRTRVELQQALAKAEIPPEIEREVLDRFTEVGLIDDPSYANAFAAGRARAGWGKRVIRMRLRDKGIDPELAEVALTEITEDDERVQATRLVERRWPRLVRQDAHVRNRRLYAMLARRGFSSDVISAAIAEVAEREVA
ncbi:MAG: recombination regulator RecX [Actinomycetia bacterium]|nr:recombination regulator RecX [Actinomycetes bacterium]